MNARLLCVPVVLVEIYFMAVRRDVARRMADIAGYAPKKNLFTVAASLTLYPFMALSAT